LRRGEEIHRGLIADFIGDPESPQEAAYPFSVLGEALAFSGALTTTMRERVRSEVARSTLANFKPRKRYLLRRLPQ
jgi:hypothetical protein